MKIYCDRNNFRFCSELLILGGLLDHLPKEAPENYNPKGKSRFHGVIETCNKLFEYVDDVDDADIVVVSYKFDGTIPDTDKPIWCFFNDDNPRSFHVPDNVTLFRTSMVKSINNPSREKAMPAFSPDYFDGTFMGDPPLTIGFCGHINNGRKPYLETLLRSDIPTNFIIRKGFWASGVDRQIARKEYFDNISQNIFNFCYRGAGNFSYRFYETLMMGKIPVLVDTDCVFPIEIKGLCVYCKENDDIIERSYTPIS